MASKHFMTSSTDRPDFPLVAAAIHSGHTLTDEVEKISGLNDGERLMEEDPFTDLWTVVTENRIIAHHSRFEVDLNRPREKAVYIEPEDAWGLQVWKTKPSPALQARLMEKYDAFYQSVRQGLANLERQCGSFVVFDLHSYNHRREGPDGAAADPDGNPEVNIGTGTMNRQRWATVVDRFIGDLGAYDFLGRHLDVRENVKFRGGQFSRWVHETFPESGCCLAIEFKKFFMDEWTGEPDPLQLEAILEALKSTVPGVLAEIRAVPSS